MEKKNKFESYTVLKILKAGQGLFSCNKKIINELKNNSYTNFSFEIIRTKFLIPTRTRISSKAR